LVLRIFLKEQLSNLKQERRVETIELIHVEKSINSVDGFVELLALQAEPDAVVPKTPTLSIDLKSLLSAGERFRHPFKRMVAIG
jgi:hypothetical protein